MALTTKVARKPTNISLPVDLCTDARNLGINISQICERSLREIVSDAKQKLWAAENAEFIAEYNKRVEAEGTLLQEWNTF
ncbi:MAG: type II toxin-antitoxin system CcdA family antitoxin [Burkholderiales bacterium]